MANPLTLLLPVIPGTGLQTIIDTLTKINPQVEAALNSVGTVHYARFLLLDLSTPNLQPGAGSGPYVLGVVTEYDGDFNAYIQDFAAKLGTIFNELLALAVGGNAVIPVADHINEFIAYIQKNDASQHLPNTGLYQAYTYTVQQILANGSD